MVIRTAGTNIGEDLDAAAAGGDPPDVAIIAQPRLVQHYAEEGRIVAIDADVYHYTTEPWNDLVRVAIDGVPKVYGAWVKGSYKSLFWYRPDVFPTTDPTAWDWSELSGWVRGHIGEQDAPRAPLTLPAKDCWPLTDLFENQLASVNPELYDELADAEQLDWAQEDVRRVLSDIAELVSPLSDGRSPLSGGPRGAAATTWQALADQVTDEEAALALGPIFVAGEVDDPDAISYFPYPRVDNGPAPVVVGGDAAVIPVQPSGDEQDGRDLVRWLTSEVAIRRWTELDPGYLTPSDDNPFREEVAAEAPADGRLRAYLTRLLQANEGELHFDLSDQFGVLSGGEPSGMSEVLFDFFMRVAAAPGEVSDAIDEAVERLTAEAHDDAQ